MNLFIVFLVTWSAQGQDKGLLLRVEPLFPQERYYGERFWVKLIFKNVSADTLMLREWGPSWSISEPIREEDIRELAFPIIYDENGHDAYDPFLGYASAFFPGFGFFSSKEPREGWSRERILKTTEGYIFLLPGDSLIKLFSVDCVTEDSVNKGTRRPGVYIFDGFTYDYSKWAGDWTGFWNGKIEIKNIGYRFRLENKPLSKETQSILPPQYGGEWGEKAKNIKNFDQAHQELIRIMKEEDPNTLRVFFALCAASELYAQEKIKPPYDEYRRIREACAKAFIIDYLIQDLKAKGYDSEFFRADYWFWLYHYRRTHIGKLGGEK